VRLSRLSYPLAITDSAHLWSTRTTMPSIALAVTLIAGAAPVLAGCGAQSSATRSGSTAAAVSAASSKLDAPAQLEPPRAAPEIALRNFRGEPVRLSQFRGKAVLLTFIYDHCPDTCPLIVSKLHATLGLLGAHAGDVQVIAVSVDPVGDTPTTVTNFLAVHQMTGRMDYLLGSKSQLGAVWKSYGVSASGNAESRESPAGRTVSHTAVVYGITASGRWLALYDALFKPSELAHDVPLLASA
jgi:protein SCO1/2